MTSKQKELLYDLLSKREARFGYNYQCNVLIHSILNTIDYYELILDFIGNGYSDLQKSLFSNLENRLHDCNPYFIYDNLRRLLDEGVDYQKRQRIRKILELLLTILNENYKIDFFNCFFYSKFANDKKIAIKYVNVIEEDIKELLLEAFYESENIEFLVPIISENNFSFLANRIEEIWSVNLPFFIKKRLIELLAKRSVSFQFIKETELDLYLLSQLVNKKITANNAIIEIEKIDPDKRCFFIFNLSKQVAYRIVEKQVSKYIDEYLKN